MATPNIDALRKDAILFARAGNTTNMLAHIVGDFSGMPKVMKRLAVVQFFSWSALFTMWIYTTPVVAQNFYGAPDPASAGYQDAGKDTRGSASRGRRAARFAFCGQDTTR